MRERHNCGGTLGPQKVRINLGRQSFLVDGFVCDKCGEQVVSRDTAVQVYGASMALKERWKNWQIEHMTTTTNRNASISSVWTEQPQVESETTAGDTGVASDWVDVVPAPIINSRKKKNKYPKWESWQVSMPSVHATENGKGVVGRLIGKRK